MMICEKSDLELAGMIVDEYNAAQNASTSADDLAQRASAIDDKVYELYGDDDNPEPDTVEVPIELFHRMAAEVQHHKSMLDAKDAGVVATIGASLTGHNYYGISKDLTIVEKVLIRAPKVEELTDVEIDKIVDCATEGFRATIRNEAQILREEIRVLRDRSTAN